MIVSNIGVDPGFSAIYTTNSAMHTAYRAGGARRADIASAATNTSRASRRRCRPSCRS